ncbi:DUF3300 domain-containing protein [Paracoccus actinidiae]|uniref:DUF3300 domain-containing protein n=1 Tax=Paracoccus actinidiae TaxID=3064531 RepID=UPI0027D26EA9|nr:DUF3300 domain-containing protein [Paracoccus sp. M09]
MTPRFLSLAVNGPPRIPVAGTALATLLVLGSFGAASGQALVGDGSIPCGSPYVVAGGDTLSRISARAYGDPMLYGFIADANWDALGGNPESVAVGMSLKIPCIDASGKEVTPEEAAKDAASMQGVVAAEGMLSADQLDTLFGPVALFPDPVLTPVLVASTFPLDVVKAARFVEESAELPDQERVSQAAAQPWDDSVRELAAGFPGLVTRMSDNIDWTEQAGEAVVAQTDNVLASIQRLRSKAQANGYLVDNEAQNVEEEGGKITIAPASPNVVYVPAYDSQVVYTTPVSGPPVYHYDTMPYYGDDDWDGNWGDALVAGGIVLGGAIILDEIFDDDDWDGWDQDDDIDWDRGDITIDRDEVNIDRDRTDLGDGRLSEIGSGDRVSIGDSERPQVDRGELRDRAGAAGIGAVAGASGAAALANRRSLATPASRDAARQKIEKRQATGAAPARLSNSRATAQRPSSGNVRQAAPRQPSAKRADRVSRPQAVRQPAARTPSRSNTFQRPSGPRPSMSSQRGRASYGGRGGGRGGGGGGGRGGRR